MSDSGIGKGIGIGLGLPCGCLLGIGIASAVLVGGCLVMLGLIGGTRSDTETTQAHTPPTDMTGEEIARDDLPGINGISVDYYIPDDSPDQLVRVARWYEKANPESHLIVVDFFDSKQYGALPRDKPMTDAEMAHHVAQVNCDVRHGKRTYQRRADGWRECPYRP